MASSGLAQLRQQILQHTLTTDRPRLLRQWRQLGRQPMPEAIAKLQAALERAHAAWQARRARLPAVEFDPHLPVNQQREVLAAAITQHPVVIVCGETGSGKTTQLPKICLELGRGVAGLIGHTQPRRLAARAVAGRLAQELKSPLGQAVGYQVRFHDQIAPENFIKVMTDGILLAETQRDRFLNAYDTIIIDEAHERSLNIDFLLGFLKQLLPRRPDLKLIITSATMDAARLSAHFDQAPIVEVSGRTYPVEIRYRPLACDEQREGVDVNAAIVDAVSELSRLGSGDILVFLAGEREIREAAEALRKQHPLGAEILPLFARLSLAEQQRVFRSNDHGRRIVLATNVAETSLTVPGIRYVVDVGTARVNRYSPRAKVTQLQVEPISQAAAQQRAGRCGRVASGVCIRLYSEADFLARPAFTDPEIIRSSLASVILRMQALQLGDVAAFPFLDAPSARLIHDGYQLLEELGAVSEWGSGWQLTTLGQQLAKLPLDPKLGRMLLAGAQQHALREVLIIAAALTVPDPRERPHERREAADQAHARFSHEKSDFMGFLALWERYDEALKHRKSQRQLQQWCRENFLSPLKMREWRDLHGQLANLMSELGWQENTTPATFAQIHTALLSGLLGQIGFRAEENEPYWGARGLRFTIHPMSVLRKAKAKWVMSAELVETGKLYARVVAKIEPEWIETVAPHVLKKQWFDPRWDERQGQVMAFERVSVYGLTIVPKRPVSYGAIAPREAREIFIREGLAQFCVQTVAPFMAHNRALLAEVAELEHKARRQDVLVDDSALVAFFEAKVPADVVNTASFEAWRKQAERTQPQLLYLSREDLMRHAAQEITETQFPTNWVWGEWSFPLRYRFEPQHPCDGVTVQIPLAVLNQLSVHTFDWLVPGMVREKLTWLCKSLPKQLRRHCVPLPACVTDLLLHRENDVPLLRQMAQRLSQRFGIAVSEEDFAWAQLPAHLQMRVEVYDEQGQLLADGRDLVQLQQTLGQAAQLAFRDEEDNRFEQTALTTWSIGELPLELHFKRQGARLTGYPALTVEDDGVVALRLFDTALAASQAHRQGVCQLLRLTLKLHLKQIEKNLAGLNDVWLPLRHLGHPEAWREDALAMIADRALIGDDPLPRDETAFFALKEKAKTRLPVVEKASIQWLRTLATAWQGLQTTLARASQHRTAAEDVREQTQRLCYLGCLHTIPWSALQHVPRYLAAAQARLEKLPNAKDSAHQAVVQNYWRQWQHWQQRIQHSGNIMSPAGWDFRWQIEELRVSLFAQQLKTPQPISAKRLDKQWQALIAQAKA